MPRFLPPADGLDRMRSPSAGNLSQSQYVPPHLPEPSSYNRREVDPRSKSTSNLHVDTSFERNDPHANMRGATSVGMLVPGVPGYRSTRPAHGGLTSDPTTTRTSRRWVVRGTAKHVGTWAGGKVLLYPSGPSALRVLPVLHSTVWHRCTQTVAFPNEKGQWVGTCIYRLWSK